MSRELACPRDLDSNLQQALCCWFTFDEEVKTVKKKDLIYWWIGQGLIDNHDEDGKEAEEAADVILKKLIEAGAIEQVIIDVKRNKMCSKYKFKGVRNEEYHDKVGMLKNGGSKITLVSPNNTPIDEKLQVLIDTLFNFGVSILTIKSDWLRKMKNLKVLHLGCWSSDLDQHIQIENNDIFKALKYLKQLRFICLKGVSGIMELGDEICCLRNLRVLDLQACPNLEVLPKQIGMLKNLTHLDVSKCYILEQIPKGITSLTKLQVLEGFVISDFYSTSSCMFKDLANHLGATLRKLCIRTRTISFPNKDDVKVFNKFKKLLKLKIEWTKTSDYDDEDEDEDEEFHKNEVTINSRSLVRNLANTFRKEEYYSSGLPEKLEKLEVQAIPQRAMRRLMLCNNENSENLKKLYIIGGDLSDLTYNGKIIKWKMVQTVQFKYLTRLHVHWRQFKATFPNVTYLEVTECPNLSFFPCDSNGVWKKAEDR